LASNLFSSDKFSLFDTYKYFLGFLFFGLFEGCKLVLLTFEGDFDWDSIILHKHPFVHPGLEYFKLHSSRGETHKPSIYAPLVATPYHISFLSSFLHIRLIIEKIDQRANKLG